MLESIKYKPIAMGGKITRLRGGVTTAKNIKLSDLPFKMAMPMGETNIKNPRIYLPTPVRILKNLDD